MKPLQRAPLGALLLAVSVSVAACTAGDQGAAEDQNRSGNPQVRTQQTVPEPIRNADQAEVTRRLTALAKSVPDVKDATCVVLGNTAIVGIDVAGNVDRSRVGTIKYAVAEALRKDPYGVNAVVTADMDLNYRLQEIGADIRAGRPVAGFAEELADIVGRIIPQLPRDSGGRQEVPQSPGATSEDRGAAKAGNPSAGDMQNNQGPVNRMGSTQQNRQGK
ncbi:YhcN/YlaJ family sporulation lipoprotein [Paenibacillus thermotolerans]|uniref:YhcN/YlaJ family sporulation lipoprotein n=1 Tax=Paenibacillus thermotolerans TaxID=3027807 RepID=UPI0023684598|nr:MULTISPECIES: YhcN/YlaJ family sporulation lipoprotein [unclassified Paenibacillus]